MTYVEFVRAVESHSWHEPNQRLLHAALGLCTEVGELLEIKSDEHLIEELGDVLWYLALGFDSLGLDFESFEAQLPEDWEIRGDRPVDSFLIYSTDLLDMVKKQIFYGREIDRHKAGQTLFIMFSAIGVYCDMADIKIEQVLEANMRKLMTRYPEKFTEEAANNRDVKAEYAAMSR